MHARQKWHVRADVNDGESAILDYARDLLVVAIENRGAVIFGVHFQTITVVEIVFIGQNGADVVARKMSVIGPLVPTVPFRIFFDIETDRDVRRERALVP